MGLGAAPLWGWGLLGGSRSGAGNGPLMGLRGPPHKWAVGPGGVSDPPQMGAGGVAWGAGVVCADHAHPSVGVAYQRDMSMWGQGVVHVGAWPGRKGAWFGRRGCGQVEQPRRGRGVVGAWPTGRGVVCRWGCGSHCLAHGEGACPIRRGCGLGERRRGSCWGAWPSCR